MGNAPHISKITYCDYSGGSANMVTGCTYVSPGCTNCYARAIYRRTGNDFNDVQWSHDKLAHLARWQPKESKRGNDKHPLVFLCDMGDLFHEAVPESFTRLVFGVLERRKDVTWLVLTKRPERVADAWLRSPSDTISAFISMDHVWVGTSVENQTMAKVRIPQLLEAWPGHKWLSVEPMLGPLNLTELLALPPNSPLIMTITQRIEWVVCGAESGPERRPFDVAWAQALYDECKDLGITFYGKQDSGLHPGIPLYLKGEIVHAWPDIML